MEELYKKTLDRLKAELKKQLPEIEANGDWLWHHPEAGFKETETQKYCLEVLKNHGFEACTWPDVTGFTCTYDTGRPGPCVMIMGEMDSDVYKRQHMVFLHLTIRPIRGIWQSWS